MRVRKEMRCKSYSMKMTSQQSTSGLPSMKNICELSNNLAEKIDNCEGNVCTRVFTKEEEISLLKQIREDEQSLCTCISCAMDRLKSLAYQVVCKKKKLYPKSWNKNRQVEQKCLEKFEERHKDEISKFSSTCKREMSQASTSRQGQFQPILTTDDERLLLIQLQKMKTRHGCRCKNCLMEEARIRALKLACDLHMDCPESWNTEGKADYRWLKGFTERHKDEISKFPSICSLTVLTIDEEQLLLSQLQDMEVQRDCRCKNCLMEEGRIRAYGLACVLHIDCPESWNTEGKADYVWLDDFTERHRDEISKFQSICSFTVLTIDQERWLLRQLQDMKIERDCRCKNCLMKEGRIRAYGLACVLRIDCAESWNREGTADYGWLEGFTDRHRDEISKFPSTCSLTVFTIDEERLLLTQLQDMKIECDCKCINCLMKDAQILAYELACVFHRDYPESWNTGGKADYRWLEGFTERHKDEISKFPSICKEDLSQASTSRQGPYQPILTIQNERMLLIQLQEMETQHGCKCQNCLLEEVPTLAYKLACNLKKDYPQSWNREGKAGSWWLNNFIERHIDEILKFPTVCNRLVSTNRLVLTNRPVLTNDDEQLLLTHLQEVKARGGCKCKNCFMKKVKEDLACKISRDLYENYPESSKDENAIYKWLRRFEERHKIEISEFPTVCNRPVLTNRPILTNRPVLTNDDEQLLLTHLQEVKARGGCKCKHCFAKDVPPLAYKIVCDLNKNYPEWKGEENAMYKWLRRFEERHKIEISEFPTVCNRPVLTNRPILTNRPVLTNDDELLLLTHLQEVKAQGGCKCKNCFMKKVKEDLACKISRDLYENYPESSKDENAIYKWLRRFEERHKIEISEFPTVCNRPVLTNRPILTNCPVLTNDDEQLLLTHLQEVKARGGCKCKHCFAKDVPPLAYKIVCDLNKNYPEWKGEENAMYKWLRRFEERHKIEISEFPTVCNRLVLTNRTVLTNLPVLTNRSVLTNDDEQLLLTHLQEVKAQGGCKCKNCFMKEVKEDLACKISRDLYENYPEWSKDKNAIYKWLRRFAKGHKIKISKFSTVCKGDLSQASTNRRSRSEPILRRKDERLLLLQLQEMETRHGCKCKSCLLEELPILAYNLACNLKRVPQSWNAEGKAVPMWLSRFKKRHNDKISEFPIVCNRPILTNDDEQLLLTHLQEVKARGGCKCKNCFVEEVKVDLACKIFRDLYKNYPEWIEDENAIYKWLKRFENRHNIEISKLPSICKEDLSQASTSNRRESCTIFRPQDEQLLLIQLQKMGTQHGCKCKICLMDEVRILAYKMACDLKRDYPESWDRERKATRYWLKSFTERHKDEISTFPTFWTRSVLTNDDEQLLLTHLQEVKARGSCKCKNCFMKEVKENLAYKISCDLYENYPEWREDENAIYKWLRRFEERHKIEISEFPTVCKGGLSQSSTSRRNHSERILRRKDERLLLLQLQEVETRHGCKCKACLLEELPILAYKLACNLQRDPKSWNVEGKAVPRWLSKFKKRHNDKISKFLTVCNRSVLTNDDEQLLLRHLQDVKARGGCKCKNCFVKEVKIDIACKISRDLYKNYPEWIEDENAIYKWLRRFEERHNIEISQFPYICKEDLSQVSTSRRRDFRLILRPKDERLLLIQLQEMETRYGCKCKNCLLEELPIQAYKLACKLKRDPQSWNEEGKAEPKWLSRFRKRHYDEISKFPTVCNRSVLTNRPVLTNDEEQLLLSYLQEVKARGGCKCKHCFAKDVPLLAYKIVRDLNKNYPEWSEDENAIYKWLRCFEERYKIEILNFPTVCNLPVLTNVDEQLLLTYLQEVKARGGCKCKHCFAKDVPLLAFKIVCDLNKNYPGWKREEDAMYKWLRRFEERHKIETSEFPSVCEAD